MVAGCLHNEEKDHRKKKGNKEKRKTGRKNYRNNFGHAKL
jgi:hypothetical protein